MIAVTRYRPIFDEQAVQSIGAIALDPKNSKNVWVGTGESWTRNSVSVGDGIYKSTDGGETWSRAGLEKSERIGRIAVDPRNSDTVFAAVPGPLWSDSPDRGLYKNDRRRQNMAASSQGRESFDRLHRH
jgi:hypothetical protein